MTTSLLSPILVTFVFAPLGIGALLLVTLMRRRTDQCHGVPSDVAASALAWIIGSMSPSRAEWGAAMLAELAVVSGKYARWRFALDCAFVALFPPRFETPPPISERSPVFGLLSVGLPLLGLPLIYAGAAILEATSGSPYTSSSWSESHFLPAVVKLLLVATVGCLVAGVPLGLAGKWRRERIPQLTGWGMASSTVMIGYFLLGMHWLAGGE
jgi:hypothetical protein